MKPRIDRGGDQGRDDPRSAAADRARLVRLWPLWVLIVVLLLVLFAWRVYG